VKDEAPPEPTAEPTADPTASPEEAPPETVPPEPKPVELSSAEAELRADIMKVTAAVPGTGGDPEKNDKIAEILQRNPLEADGRIATVSYNRLIGSTDAKLAVVQAVAEANRPELRACYIEQLEKDPEIRSTLLLKITVDEAGTATSASAKGPGKHLKPCAIKAAKGWAYPPGNSGTHTVSINFDQTDL